MSATSTPPIRVRHRHKPTRRRVAMLSSEGMLGLTPATAGTGPVPRLVMAEPEDRRATWVSGSLTTLLHLLALAVIVTIGL